MKAKLYTLGTTLEVLVSNKTYTSVEGEDKKAFLKRVKLELEKDFDEAIDIVDVKTENLEKLDDQMLSEAYKVSRGLQEQILKGILEVRGIAVEKIEKTIRKKIEKVDLETAKSTEAYKLAKENVGKLVQYTPTKSEEVIKGVIKSVSFNKTNTTIYYNVQSGTTLKCCTSNNASIVFFEF